MDNVLFQRFNRLEELCLSNVSLEIRDFSPFANLKALRQLDISKNNLTHMRVSATLEPFKEMQNFNAENCHMETSDVANLLKMFGSSLQILSLNGNNVSKVEQDAFASFTSLTRLELENACLTTFDSINFPKKIKQIFIADNLLERVDLLTLPESVTDLDLKRNQLVSLELPKSLPNLNYLGIANNQMTCSYLIELKTNYSDTKVEDALEAKRKDENMFQGCLPDGPIIIDMKFQLTMDFIAFLLIFLPFCFCVAFWFLEENNVA